MAENPGGLPIGDINPNGFKLSVKELKDMKDGDTVCVFVKAQDDFAVIQKVFKVKRIEGTDRLELAPFDELGPEEERRQLAHLIVTLQRENIMKHSVEAVETALSRKPRDKLVRMIEATKRGAKAKITSREGCMYIEIGEDFGVL